MPFDDRDRARRHRPARGGVAGPGRRARRPTSSSTASPTGRRTVRRGGRGGGRARPEADPRRPARQPGWPRDRGPRDRQPVPPRRHDLLGGGQPGQPDGDDGQARGVATDPSIHRCSSTAGPRRRPRSSPGRSTTGAGDRRRQQDLRQGHGPAVDQLEDDSGGFRLTIAKWLTPDKTWVHGAGSRPDVVVADAPAKPATTRSSTRRSRRSATPTARRRPGDAPARVHAAGSNRPLARAHVCVKVDGNERR